MLFIEKRGVPSLILNRVVSIAAFSNPDYFKALRMQVSVWGKPRVISCGEDFPDHIGLPRGCEAEAKEFLNSCSIAVEIEDKRHDGHSVHCAFVGRLAEDQERADTVG